MHWLIDCDEYNNGPMLNRDDIQYAFTDKSLKRHVLNVRGQGL